MAAARPPIPAALRREVLVEAGHRCAIPTCRQTPIDMAHIKPFATVRDHSFDNLIALCPTCHRRYDADEIDRQSMLQYKANLSVIAGRYGDVERRVLSAFAEQPKADSLPLPGGLEIMILHLLHDGLLVDTGMDSGVQIAGIPSHKIYAITPKGRDFIERWLRAAKLE